MLTFESIYKIGLITDIHNNSSIGFNIKCVLGNHEKHLIEGLILPYPVILIISNFSIFNKNYKLW